MGAWVVINAGWYYICSNQNFANVPERLKVIQLEGYLVDRSFFGSSLLLHNYLMVIRRIARKKYYRLASRNTPVTNPETEHADVKSLHSGEVLDSKAHVGEPYCWQGHARCPFWLVRFIGRTLSTTSFARARAKEMSLPVSTNRMPAAIYPLSIVSS
jgi:hypothetical protein